MIPTRNRAGHKPIALVLAWPVWGYAPSTIRFIDLAHQASMRFFTFRENGHKIVVIEVRKVSKAGALHAEGACEGLLADKSR